MAEHLKFVNFYYRVKQKAISFMQFIQELLDLSTFVVAVTGTGLLLIGMLSGGLQWPLGLTNKDML